MRIKTESFIKVLNATEAGETNTNDSYVLIPKRYNARSFFGSDRFVFDARLGSPIGTKVNLRYELARGAEQRVYQLGAFCRDHNVRVGDAVCIEKRIINDDPPVFIIRATRKQSVVVLQRSHQHYIIMRNDLGIDFLSSPHQLSTPDGERQLTFEYVGEFARRSDSPDKIRHYDVKLGGIKLFIEAQYVEINGENNSIYAIEPFKYYAMEQEQ